MGITVYFVTFNRRSVDAAEASYRAAKDQFNLGQRQFELMSRQIAASFKPIVQMTLTPSTHGSTWRLDKDVTYRRSATLNIRNIGALSLKLKAVSILVANIELGQQEIMVK